MKVGQLKLLVLAVGIAAAGPALGYQVTVASKATTFGGAGAIVDVDTAAATPRVDCAVTSPVNCVGTATATEVALSAVPAAGSVFVKWDNCPDARTTYNAVAGNYCVLPGTSADRKVYAWFKPTAYSVTVKPGLGGTITVGTNPACAAGATCTYPLAAGATVNLVATPEAGKLFQAWSGCTSATATCSLTVTGAKTVTASFFTGADYKVAVSVSGTAPAGSITGTGIACPGDCVGTVAPAGSLTLTAATEGFQAWYGCTSAAANVCNLTNVNGNQAVTAVYATTSCGACHGKPPPSHGPSPVAANCASCHTGFTKDSAPAGHADGTVTLGGAPVAKPNVGFQLEILSVSYDPANAVTPLAVQFKVSDPVNGGAALALGAGGVGNPALHVARLNIGAAGDATYKSYATRNSTGANYTLDGVLTTPAVASTVQDTSWTFADGVLTNEGGGVYTYRFGTAAKPLAAALADQGKLHTVAMYATRAVSGYSFRSHDSFDFRPDGVAVTPREVVTDAACNACHGELQLHGQRRGVKNCLACHNPNTTDPESGNSVDLAYMIHKIHNGHLLANRYYIVGYGTSPNQAVLDTSHILMAPSHSGYFESSNTTAYPVHDPGLSRECGICHGGAAQGGNAYSKPSIRTCGSCHDTVNFATHMGGQTDSACATCHNANPGAVSNTEKVHSRFFEPLTNTDFRAATPPVPANGHDFQVEIVSVATMDPTPTSTIVFTVNVTLDGAPYDIKALATLGTGTTGPFRLGTCNFQLAGPTTDYVIPNTGSTAVSCSSGAAWTDLGGGQFQFKAAPTWLTGKPDGYYTAAYEIMISRQVDVSGTLIRKPFSANPNFKTVKKVGNVLTTVTEPVELALNARRQVVSFDKCNACHVDLGFHSNRNRKGPDYCATCHNPKLDNGTRARVKVSQTKAAAEFDPELSGSVYLPESVSMNMFIHRIHMGSRLPSVSGADLETGAATASKWVPKAGEIVYGATRSNFVGASGTTEPELADFTSFTMPNTMNRCDQCHISQGANQTWALNEGTGLAPVERTLKACNPTTFMGEDWCSVASSGNAGMPAKTKNGSPVVIVTPPLKATCTGCHDSAATDAHADAFTFSPMTAGAVEYCASCHGAGKVFDALNAHRPVP